MFQYNLYGLTIQTNEPLRNLTQIRSNSTVDIYIKFSSDRLPVHFSSLPFCHGTVKPIASANGNLFYRLISGKKRRWFQVVSGINEKTTVYTISGDGKNIHVVHNEHSDHENVHLFLLHPILGFALRLQNIVCLHATSITIGDYAIALLGKKGAGKSTTAAALHLEGFEILADDLSALLRKSQQFLVQPGLPQLRLIPRTAQFLYGSQNLVQEVLPGYAPGVKKVYLRPQPADPSRKPLALAAVYFLEKRQKNLEEICISDISPLESLSLLTLNTSHRQILDKNGIAHEFNLLADFVKKVPIRRVRRPNNLDRIPEVVQAILKDISFLREKNSH